MRVLARLRAPAILLLLEMPKASTFTMISCLRGLDQSILRTEEKWLFVPVLGPRCMWLTT